MIDFRHSVTKIFIISAAVILAVVSSCTNEPELINFDKEKILSKDIPINMIKITGGSFIMGAKNPNEKPRHKVYLDDYYLGKYEVTQALWYKVTKKNPLPFQLRIIRSKRYVGLTL